MDALRAGLREKGIPFLENEPMSKHTTLRLGGPADLFVMPRSAEEAAGALHLARQEGAAIHVIGNGSNLLVLDGGIRGMVLKPQMTDMVRRGETLEAGAGCLLPSLAEAAAAQGLEGLAFASGIPASLGGAVYMNAGAYGGEMAQVVTRVDVLTPEGEEKTLYPRELDFSYRHSSLQGGAWVVTGAAICLRQGDPEAIRAAMAELRARRQEKQPLQYPSAGSTFKRPQGDYAARLIDQCGLRGVWVGGAQVSEKHAGFLLNRGGTARDFVALMELVRQRVLEETGFLLEAEVRVLGEA